jgi:hypothetical protein
MNLSRLDQKPQIIGSSLVEVADALISQIP